MIGALWLFWFALQGKLDLFIGVFVILSLSDCIDGRLARWLKQRSDFGARLDSFADSVLYGALLFGMLWLRWDVLMQEMVWWIVGLLSYFLTTAAGLLKLGRVPSYPTYGAKISNGLVLIGAVCLVLDYSVWPFRLAMLGGTRAEGEQVWQPENGTSRTPQLPQTAAVGSSLRELGKIGAVLNSGCQTLHHSGKLSGVNELDLGQSN